MQEPDGAPPAEVVCDAMTSLDLVGSALPEERAYLRHPFVVDRWRAALLEIRVEIKDHYEASKRIADPTRRATRKKAHRRQLKRIDGKLDEANRVLALKAREGVKG